MLIIGYFVFSRETLRVVFGAAYSARMTMAKSGSDYKFFSALLKIFFGVV